MTPIYLTDFQAYDKERKKYGVLWRCLLSKNSVEKKKIDNKQNENKNNSSTDIEPITFRYGGIEQINPIPWLWK
jgi:hypothetical protein